MKPASPQRPPQRPAAIAFLLPDCGGGGAEPMTIRLANEFADRGYRVTLIVFAFTGPNTARVSARVKVVDLRLGLLFLAPLALARQLRRDRPQVLISSLFHANLCALLARRLLPGSGIRVVATEHNMLSLHVRHSRRHLRRLFKPLARLLYRFADQVVGVSRGVADDIQAIAGLPDRKVSAIHNPVVDTRASAGREGLPARPTALRRGKPLIVTAGRLEPQKDHSTLLRAFRRLIAQRPAMLVIAGEGSLRPRLEAEVATLGLDRSVSLPGYLPDLRPLFGRADLFVLSSLYEGLPTVLIEALASGLPVVATDCPSGPAEILAGGTLGRLVPPADPERLAQAMEQALAAPLAPETQKRGADRFSIQHSADAYEAVLHRILNPAGDPFAQGPKP